MKLEIRQVPHVTEDHYVRAYLGGIYVGSFSWALNGEIRGVWVHEDYRRQGIATELYREAQRLSGGRLKHSCYRTNEGDAWARSVGGRLPARA